MKSGSDTQTKEGGVSGPLANLKVELSKVGAGLADAKEELKKIQLLTSKGTDKLQQEKLLEGFADFQKAFEKMREEIEDHSEKIPGAPMRNFADQQRQKEYEKSIIGCVEKFAKEQFERFKEKFEGQINVVKNNKIVKAVIDVVKAVCNAVVTITKNTLNNLIVTGEVAQSVVALGGVVKAAIDHKPVQTMRI